jgi:glycosyltransferase involved in cell wall biosynthesis
MKSPVVTICVPTYNKAGFLAQSLLSILEQTFVDFKLIVVDDNSIDDTRAVVDSFRDPRVAYVQNEENLGLAGNWNRCVELALREESRYIALYHDDDVYAPTILEREVLFLDTHPHVGLVHTALHYYHEEEKRYTRRVPYPTDRVIGPLELLDDLCRRGVYHITTPSVMARREAYLRAGKFDNSFRICPDLDLWWRMLKDYDLGYISETLVMQRIHRDQVSSSAQGLQHALTQKESLAVLERAITGLYHRCKEIDIDRYQKGVKRYFAKQTLRAGVNALLEGNTEALLAACAHARNLDPTFRVYLEAKMLTLLDNAGGRVLASVVYKTLRRLKSKHQPITTHVANTRCY